MWSHWLKAFVEPFLTVWVFLWEQLLCEIWLRSLFSQPTMIFLKFIITITTERPIRKNNFWVSELLKFSFQLKHFVQSFPVKNIWENYCYYNPQRSPNFNEHFLSYFYPFYHSQELDYVYHDVSAVMTETLMQGADIIAMKVSPIHQYLLYQNDLCY